MNPKTEAKKSVKSRKSAGNKKLITITKSDNLGEIIYKYPNTAEVFLDYGLHCVGCFAASFDTVEAGALAHGLKESDINEMLERLNEVVNFKE